MRYHLELPMTLPMIGKRVLKGDFKADTPLALVQDIRTRLPSIAASAVPWYAKGKARGEAEKWQQMSIERLMAELRSWWNDQHLIDEQIPPLLGDLEAQAATLVAEFTRLGVVTCKEGA